jgi:hypothetical protein
MESMTESEIADLMEQFTALPADVQARLSAIQGGGEDPGPATTCSRPSPARTSASR